ncbi:ABC transporter permease [Nocardioides sp. 1609]|uniref:ABC transporter permease n=1 Tax=Nocardioides sp. 1609 TaxID=2508327 RepID=UPI00107025EB|nr:ABC transporter permease [Nocardioides sp. 1609]
MSAASGSLPRYILVRLLLVIPMMWVLLTLVFLLLRVAPGDPVTAAVGDKLGPEELDARRAALGLDRPMIVQYLEYLGDAARFDFGTTISDRRPVLEIIQAQGGATLTLTVGAFLFACLIGIPLGRVAGRRRDTPLDAGIRLFGVVSYAAPVFWVGLMLVGLVVKYVPGWPTFGIADPETIFYVPDKTGILLLDAIIANDRISIVDILQHHVLPCFTLGLLLSGVIIRLVRVNLIRTLGDDYVEAARARGIPERQVIRKHAFRNALVPVITVIGLQFALTLSGAILTERTFNWPGLGDTLVDYITARDYIAIQGLVTFFALAIVVVSLLVDILNALVDPRVRY